MPIPQRVIDSYLARQLPSLSWVKELTEAQVDEELSYIRPAPTFRCPLRHDQKVMFLLGVAYPGLVIMSDLGSGKSAVSLELLSYFYECGLVRRAFVFTPTDEVSDGWRDEIARWGYSIPHVRLTGSSRDKWGQLATLSSGVVIGTYIGIAAMVSKLYPVEGADRQKREIVLRLIRDIVRDVDAVVYDQSTKLGSNASLSYKVCREFSAVAKFRYALAGRAFGRDAFVLWSQFYLTDRGAALGTSPGLFRETFWRREASHWGTKWTIRKRREPVLAAAIAASSIRYAIDECVQLPPKVRIRKECAFPAENWTYYDQVREELLAARGNYREVQNSFLRMRQISSGFVGFIDDDTGERAQIEFVRNPKLDLLMELIDEVPDDRKLVVFYEYTWSGARICRELLKSGRKFGWLWAGTKDWTQIKQSFNEDPDFRIIVANWRKASMGLNLQSASYLMFFESPISMVERHEAEGRIFRPGQKHKSLIFDLIMQGSIDERILDFHKEGVSLWKALIENPASIVKNSGSV